VPTPPPPRVGGADADSGIVDLKVLASLDPFGAMRAKTTPLAANTLFDEEETLNASEAAQGPPPEELPTHVSPWSHPNEGGAAPEALNDLVPDEGAEQAHSGPISGRHRPNVSAILASARAQLDAPPPSEDSSKTRAYIGWGMAALAVAAGVVFFIKTRQHEAPAPIASAPSVTAEPTPAASATVAPPSTSASAAPEPEKVASADDLPLAKKTPGDLPKSKGVSKISPPSLEEKSASNAKPTAKPKEEAIPAPPPQQEPQDLHSEIEKRAGPKESPKQETADSTGSQSASNVPQRPSAGEVTGAINAALPNARACLGPDDPVSYATVIFDSNGKVQSVSVSGGAEGKPAADCIKTAMTRVRLQPFAESTFTARATVRP
ncbi:MAG TPA: hypothetical protein VGE84_05440, partial [Allosphingosinicella sp.]